MLAAAARFSGGDEAICFGGNTQRLYAQARERELAALSAEPPAAALPAYFGAGGEHQLHGSAELGHLVKRTLPGFYGRILDECRLLDPRTFLMRPQLAMRGALPSEYLRRWSVLHDVFGTVTTYLGITLAGKSEPQMVVAQPYIAELEDDPATLADVTALMEAHHFTRVDATHIVNPEIKDVTWYRQSDGILITDAHARNFRKDITGVLIAIDLVVTTVPKGITQILPEPLSEWAPTTL